MPAGGHGCGRAVSHGGRELADRLGPAVPRGKDARNARGAVLARFEPAGLVQVRQLRKGRVRGLVAHRHEEPVHLYAPALSARDRLYHQARELAEVTGLRREGKGFAVITPEGEYAAKTVILATGAQHRRLGVPREEELAGNGVCYCAVCDGAFYKDRPVAVAGGGDAALQDALLLSNGSSKVYIIHRRDEFRAEAANVSAARSRPALSPGP